MQYNNFSNLEEPFGYIASVFEMVSPKFHEFKTHSRNTIIGFDKTGVV